MGIVALAPLARVGCLSDRCPCGTAAPRRCWGVHALWLADRRAEGGAVELSELCRPLAWVFFLVGVGISLCDPRSSDRSSCINPSRCGARLVASGQLTASFDQPAGFVLGQRILVGVVIAAMATVGPGTL